jgi:hypothetical protein
VFESYNYWYGEKYIRDFVRIKEEIKDSALQQEKLNMIKESEEKVCGSISTIFDPLGLNIGSRVG